MTYATYVDAEDIAKAWLLTTSVATLVNNKVFMAMPTGAPLPSVILSRVGGAPPAGSDVPCDFARISFSCYAATRPQAKDIAKALASEIESLAYTGPVDTAAGRVDTAQVASWVWFPDGTTDTPRYILDALMVVRAVV